MLGRLHFWDLFASIQFPGLGGMGRGSLHPNDLVFLCFFLNLPPKKRSFLFPIFKRCIFWMRRQANQNEADGRTRMRTVQYLDIPFQFAFGLGVVLFIPPMQNN